MGCGHGKISIIYSRKSKSKRNSKKSAPEKSDSEEEDGTEKEKEKCVLEEDEQEKKNQVKVSLGGPLLPSIDISSSQQDFFKMLDEKIENGPDYNSESETEILAEHRRITALLKDWESASAGSRSSLNQSPPTKPQTNRAKQQDFDDKKFNDNGVQCNNNVFPNIQRSNDTGRNYSTNSVLASQSIIHQNYGVALLQDSKQPQGQIQQYYYPTPQQSYHQTNVFRQPHAYQQQQQPPSSPAPEQYRQVYNNFNYVMHHPSTPQHAVSYPTQYQVMSPMYSQVNQPPPSSRQYPGYNNYPIDQPIASVNNGRSQPFRSSSQDDHNISISRGVTTKSQTEYGNGVLIQPRFSNPAVQFKGTREQPQVHFQNSPSTKHHPFLEQHQSPSSLVNVNPTVKNIDSRAQYQQVPISYPTVPIVVRTNNEVICVPRKPFPSKSSPE